jgi:hypothetical protein
MTLNLLRTLRINPRLSAWSQVHGISTLTARLWHHPALAFSFACASGIINDTVKQRRSKAMDMRFIGSKTASPKTNTSSIGAKAATTSLTTSPSIIPRLTIASCARGIWSTYTDQLLCKGVLNLPRNHFRVTLRSRPQTSRIA